MNKNEFYYDLPPELIAQEPLPNRSDSRLLVLEHGKITHRKFTDIKEYLHKGDCLVLNDTRVLPARLHGVKRDTGAAIEFLLLKRLSLDTWEVILKPGRRAKEGAEFVFSDRLSAKIIKVLETGNRIVQFIYDDVFEDILSSIGEVPLPPYITKKLDDKERYQTVYSRENGSAAAPTAGLHFTNELLSEISDMGVEIVYITLHVGLGTFRPVKTEKIEDHIMHTESYHISQEAADKINKARENGGRIIAVGTTSVRTLESAAAKNMHLSEMFDDTDIFIYPGYKFKVVDALITNFHLPESTLIMLVSALAGKENIMRAYDEAIKEKYRFFSFGDAMFIV
ncbi:MAG: tRNA preQ1(34) S-adenosylmethionine ribosyltransferase-isomerase QueA [Clostridia bacterium]|nr:tRNA preQ1(34) S-adenosylmethionine ribosyltransferase-isomerase QueA [Clostridia bacterium]